MAKISVIGLCGQSTFMNVDHFHQKGETVYAKKIYKEIGGKGFNQAIAAKRMGVDVSFLAAVGNDPDGKQCQAVLAKEGINDFLAVKTGIPTTFAFILVDKSGENQVTGYYGAELSCDDVMNFASEIESSDYLLLQQEVPKEVNETAIMIAQKCHVPVILNPAPEGCIPEFHGKLFAVTPNEHEQTYIDLQNFEHSAVTLGKDGCLVDQTMHIPAVAVTAVDTTGAGDTFNGTMAAMLAKHHSFDEACRIGVCAASMSVTKQYVTDSIPYLDEVEQKMKEERLIENLSIGALK